MRFLKLFLSSATLAVSLRPDRVHGLVRLGLGLGECHRVVTGEKEYAGALPKSYLQSEKPGSLGGSNKAPRTVRKLLKLEKKEAEGVQKPKVY
jgi:hypothetical protein